MIPEEAFDVIVRPALLEYGTAERGLTLACVEKSDPNFARADVLRRGRTAAIELHQFADRVFESQPQPAWMPPAATVHGLRKAVEDSHCLFLGGSIPMKDLSLLHDIADAYKHVRLEPRASRRVLTDQATLPISTGFGQLLWGEGKWGGVEQAIVTQTDQRQRALSSILLNAANAWLVTMGLP